jgi:hypothetical protein
MIAPLRPRVRPWLPEGIALVFPPLTTWLLVDDLARPSVLPALLTPAQHEELARARRLDPDAFGAVTSAILAARWLRPGRAGGRAALGQLPLGLATAGYTAFLFAQCEGRDLWQERALLPHLLVQALFLGAGALLPFTPVSRVLLLSFGVGLVLHSLFVTLELRKHHATENARQAAGFLRVVELGPLPPPAPARDIAGHRAAAGAGPARAAAEPAALRAAPARPGCAARRRRAVCVQVRLCARGPAAAALVSAVETDAGFLAAAGVG